MGRHVVLTAGVPAAHAAQQLFVVVNLERTERGFPRAVVLSKSLTAVVRAGEQSPWVPARGPGGGGIR